ncbi:MAG: 50S ribosomal protein L18, partial [Acidobacteriaceae bacterium]|nr:50S ribosomal protein L18 [Acidobacteriaceae bacterium]
MADTRREIRSRIHKRIRSRVAGTQERPRLAVFRSLNHIYAQV